MGGVPSNSAECPPKNNGTPPNQPEVLLRSEILLDFPKLKAGLWQVVLEKKRNTFSEIRMFEFVCCHFQVATFSMAIGKEALNHQT